MRVLHQAGHNTVWNIKSYEEDNAGDGIIFSPVHYTVNNIEKVQKPTKQVSLFDPQFYIPDSQKNKLQTYEFFPEKLMNGFETIDYQSIAHKSAKLCLEFQLQQDFESIIIPCRFYDDLLTDFIERQKAFTVEPFLNELSRIKHDKDIYISLSLTAPMIIDKRFRNNILNWITSYQEIDGVYLQVDFGERSKQIQNYEKLYNFVEFVNELIEADLKVICGYMNTEGLLISALDINAVTMGAYENTRMFSTDKFLVNDGIKTGPAPRIYLPNLLNWIRYDTAVEIKEDFPDLWSKVYIPTQYSEEVLATAQKPHFSQPKLYKHFFMLINQQYKELSSLNVADKINRLSEKVTAAHELYTELESRGVLFFDANCKGDHLIIWNRILRNIRNSV
ncbi:MAG TPA: hypothetical protein DCS48_01335 [Desulfovibrio sp.]|nr:hypothetical protein [Desulfovibrio sp.]